jgi:oxygen-independent coproporphyrinogen-3 oxidase
MSAGEFLEVAISGERIKVSPAILEKYDRPGPRYTSYPTAPEWTERFGPEELSRALEESNSRPNPAPLSLYFHIPFCASLCLYCGCNVIISKDRKVADAYLVGLKREIELLSSKLNPSRQVEQLHWGGGTPTYLSAEQIEELYGHIRSHFSFSADAEISVEVDPRITSYEQCWALKKLGFNRISFGIQDFDPIVQQRVRRIQPYEMTRDFLICCRELGFESINVDLIYGLPHQTADSFKATLDKVISLGPDRIAVFSYAHVPWIKKQQRSFEPYLPGRLDKFLIFCRTIQELTGAGYRYIGLDHFARPEDELCRAQDERTLQRSFQGYTTRAGCDLLGMGVSAISSVGDTYAQNWRDLSRYYDSIGAGTLATMRGMRLSNEDKLRRSVINRILCHCVVVKSEIERDFGICFDRHFAPEMERLGELERDGLARLEKDHILLAPLGRIFARNVAMIFDQYLAGAPSGHAFSRTL